MFHIKYMRKEDELWKSDNARGITRMSDDQRLGLTMIIYSLKKNYEKDIQQRYGYCKRKCLQC